MSNRILLAGVAAVAMFAGASAASAQGKFEVKVGGDAMFEAGLVNQDRDTGLNSTEFRNRFRLTVTPTAKADNGLEYGARLRLRTTSNSGVDSDRAYMFAQGTFGRVEAGSTEGVMGALSVFAPTEYGTGGIYGADGVAEWVAFLNGSSSAGAIQMPITTVTALDNSTRISYYTPRFSGFQAGVSFQPSAAGLDGNGGDNGVSVNRSKYAFGFVPGYTGGFSDVYEVGANYTGTVSNVGLKASLGYAGGEAKKNGMSAVGYHDLGSLQAGAQVSYAGFTLGGGYVFNGKSGQSKAAGLFTEDADAWNVGLQYATGPYAVGVSYQQSTWAGDLTARGTTKTDAINVGASYAVAPGLQVGADYTYFTLRPEAGNGLFAKDKGSIAIVQTKVAF